VSRYARFNVFSLAFGVAYMALFFVNELHQWAPFGYYPVLGSFSRARLPLADAGPAIFWYAWVAGATLASVVLALLTPSRFAERLGRVWVWAVPAALLLATLVYERRWFY
jgi:hypothetical protein